MPALETDLNTEILKSLDEVFNEHCEWKECDVPRTHLLACPKCPALENLCEAHTTMIKASPPRERIFFDKSCRHLVPAVACGKIRVSN